MVEWFSSMAEIRVRKCRSQRRRDGLIRFAFDNTSQNGEDGVIQAIWDRLNDVGDPNERYCVDVGAWDGVHLSNTRTLMESGRWKGVFIEADQERLQRLRNLYPNEVCLGEMVSGKAGAITSLQKILCNCAYALKLQSNFDFLCIDVDGADYWVMRNILDSDAFHPRVICVEFNPTMPQDLIYIPPNNDSIRHGTSLAALVELAEMYGYTLVETTLFNAFFVQRRLYEQYFQDLVPDTSIEALQEVSMGTHLYQLYDGRVRLHGTKRLLWHRIAMDEEKIQFLTEQDRTFPFAPMEHMDSFDMSVAVDISPYTNPSNDEDARAACRAALITSLHRDGFCYVRGTKIGQKECKDALVATSLFLQEAQENVRRSTLATDRARRGYSPMCTENFASLIGEHGPNDLVRKFRVGGSTFHSPSSLQQPNVWPSHEIWDQAPYFQNSIEIFYQKAREATNVIVAALCEALVERDPALKEPLSPLQGATEETLSSILTLLGYRTGSRHKGKNKGPLVAAHTDVGVVTFLIFDGGDCASLERSDGKGGWITVDLPKHVPEDPVFVVNIADCFSELSAGALPSTLHRVVARPGSTPRNCCALFHGLDPHVEINVDGLRLTFEDWRKNRIDRAQRVLRGGKTN